MTPQTLEQLRKINVGADKELKLEFFFYTNSLDKAAALSAELKKLNYESDHGLAAGSKTQYLVNGWTTKMKMSDQVVSNWTKEMCEISYKFDCEFDGWGTNPDQDVN
jgi:regulator of RNase E activity RraB